MDNLICPDCGAELKREDWWDDPPEHGGACIGYIMRCPSCDYAEYH